MQPEGDFDVDEFLNELAEIGVGAAILGLRRVNINRRKLVEEIPQLEPVVDAVFDHVEALVQPVSSVVGAALSGLGDAIEGHRGAQLHEAGLLVANMGPELLRLSGLTKRD